MSGALSNSQKQDKFQPKACAFVRRVVPDDIYNVDGMMTQIKCREDELIRTL